MVCFGSLSFSFAFAFAFALLAYAAHSVHLARATLGVNICIKSIPAINTVYLQICKILLIFLALKSMPSNLNSEFFEICLQIFTTCPLVFIFTAHKNIIRIISRCLRHKLSLLFKNYFLFNDSKLKAILNSVKSPPHT